MFEMQVQVLLSFQEEGLTQNVLDPICPSHAGVVELGGLVIPFTHTSIKGWIPQFLSSPSFSLPLAISPS